MAELPVVVSTEWLHQRIYGEKNTNDKLRILDVTWYSDKDAMQEFSKRHILGAVHFNAFQGVELSPVYPRKLADAATFEMNARGSGVDSDSHVILYDGCDGRNGFFLGGRVWLMFKIYGHDKVSVLDGGLEKWMADGYEVTDMCMKIQAGNFEAKCRSKEWLHSFDDMVEKLKANDAFAQPVCDSRPPTLYNGNTEDPKSGRYPGAVNIHSKMIICPERGCLKTVDEIKQVFKDAGLDLNKPTTFMCNSGMSSCSMAMAAYMCGCPDISVYMEGFTEWRHRAEDHHIEKS